MTERLFPELFIADDLLEDLDVEVPRIYIWFHREDFLWIKPSIFYYFFVLYFPDYSICLYEKDILCTRSVLSFAIFILEIIARDREWIHMEFLPTMREDLFSVHLEKVSFQSELFLKLSKHRLMKRFSGFYVTTREDPRSTGLMASHEDLSFWIEYECAHDRFHN
jgi:hypothetical protein